MHAHDIQNMLCNILPNITLANTSSYTILKGMLALTEQKTHTHMVFTNIHFLAIKGLDSKCRRLHCKSSLLLDGTVNHRNQ